MIDHLKVRRVSSLLPCLITHQGSKPVGELFYKEKGVNSSGQSGFTLVELLVAMVMLAMVSVMIYSILNVGIKFTDKGGRSILEMERKYGFVSLVQRQIKSALYDKKKKEILMSANDEIFRVVTRNPYIYQSAGVVLAIYRYNSSERIIYYTEKRDYYNIDYDDQYVPDFDEMTILAIDEDSFSMSYDKETGPEVLLTYREEEYGLIPRCVDEQALGKLEL